MNTGWSRISSEKRWSVADSAAGVYSIEVPAAAAEPAILFGEPLDHLLQAVRASSGSAC